ncbi:MAG: complex I NDUFA9 subunit family protein [Burkholderiales bacterium]|nr:complex I NDUFA9 subunit family protein [Burkholderiales bacterium]
MRYTGICVIGGSGFIGASLVNKLIEQGYRVRVPTRRAEAAKALAMLPGVELIECNVNQPDGLARALRGCDAAINLVGILHGRRGTPYGPEFAAAHVGLPGAIAAACEAAGIGRLLHMSALGADPNGPSMYLRSKGDGEAAARSRPGLAVTVFRPSVVFGPGDNFLNMFARMQRHLPCVPLACAGARFQPIHVADVAQAFVNALPLADTVGRTYELGGPQVYTLAELVRIAGLASDHPRPIIALPDGLGRLQAAMLEHAPGGPLLTRDNLDSMRVDNVLSGPISPELGLVPRHLDSAIDYLLGRLFQERLSAYRTHAGR